jgi:murein DD-endopeptidase MepM/ murein hydrolase activator NlpD
MATYKVKKGDTLRTIAAKAGISLKELIDLNPQISNPNLTSGQVINTSKTTAAKGPTADSIIQQYTDAASGDTYLKGRYGPGSGLTAPGTIATQATPVTVTPVVPVTPATATPIETTFGADERAAEAIASGNEAVKDINEVLGSLAAPGATGPTGGRTVVSTFTNPATGDVFALYSDGTRELLFEGTKEADAETAAAAETLAAEQAARLAAEAKTNDGRSAYSLLLSEFEQYGLGALVEPLKKFIEEGLSPAEFTIRLRETDAYKKRFAANAQRVAKGLRSLSEAEYIRTEDQYQDVMRRYGMPESYYAKGDLGVQSGFEKFLAGDVSAVELEDRIQTAQNRVVNSNPEVARALKEFYPGISNGDILAYVLDPANAIEQIKRKVTAAEIGGAAIQSGLKTGMTRAEELAAAGITKQQAQQGFQTVAEVAPRGGVLAEIYNQGPYTQTTAEQEVFGLAGSVDAAKQRKKLTQLETASFSGSAGMGAIARDRAGAF